MSTTPDPSRSRARQATPAAHAGDHQRHRDGQARWPELRDRYSYAAQHGSGRVARTGEPELIEEVTDDLLASVAHDDEHLELMRQLGPVSLVAVCPWSLAAVSSVR